MVSAGVDAAAPEILERLSVMVTKKHELQTTFGDVPAPATEHLKLAELGAHTLGIILTILISTVLTMLATVGTFLVVKRFDGPRP